MFLVHYSKPLNVKPQTWEHFHAVFFNSSFSDYGYSADLIPSIVSTEYIKSFYSSLFSLFQLASHFPIIILGRRNKRKKSCCMLLADHKILRKLKIYVDRNYICTTRRLSYATGRGRRRWVHKSSKMGFGIARRVGSEKRSLDEALHPAP